MESVEAFLDGEWESLSKLFSCEDSDTHLHFNGGNFPAAGQNVAGVDATLFFPSLSVSQESSNTTESPAVNADDYMNFSSMDTQNYQSSIMPVFGDDLMEEILQLKAQMCNNAEGDEQPAETGDSCNEMQGKTKPDQGLGKRTRVSRNAQSRKKKKGCNEQSSTACSSDSESNGKAKGSKGPATDAQSLYARKRRERINERLKMLQNLVPNGTKVDISTMLEEAVHYVKFLQLQIKLLSSDDMWMYAPIAYNGMDMGLYQKINVPNIWPQN